MITLIRVETAPKSAQRLNAAVVRLKFAAALRSSSLVQAVFCSISSGENPSLNTTRALAPTVLVRAVLSKHPQVGAAGGNLLIAICV